MMTAQLRAALVRALLPAATSALIAFFGVDAATGNAAKGAAKAAVAQVNQAATGQAPTSEVVTNHVEKGAQDSAGGQQAVAAALTGLVVLGFRGFGEGIYDGRRQKAGIVKESDISPSGPAAAGPGASPQGLWLDKDGDTKRYFLVNGERAANGTTRYLVTTEGEAPSWVTERDVGGWAHWGQDSPLDA
jgi:hypothetical protein